MNTGLGWGCQTEEELREGGEGVQDDKTTTKIILLSKLSKRIPEDCSFSPDSPHSFSIVHVNSNQPPTPK